MQTKLELEDWYGQPDPWGYKTNPEDEKRRNEILKILIKQRIRYHKALDIGCGEGFITSVLPADTLHGIDLSSNALNRMPDYIKSVAAPEGFYDLVISTGTLYPQYDHESIAKMIESCVKAKSHVLIAGIKDRLLNYTFGKVIDEIEFPYREFTQKMTLYEVGA